MISVLIPVYNTDARALIIALQKQLQKEDIPFEILLLDDASLASYLQLNRQLRGVPCCTYEERAFNKGRLETRKELAQKAKYPWLLFIDSDCIIEDVNYINNYKGLLDKEYDVIIGGTSYPNQEPKDCALRLHWKYANHRIAINTTRFRKNIYSGFLFNNVIFRRDLFNDLNFPDWSNRYGHEDTWLGIALEQKKAKLLFINNPVLHQQLDKSEFFLKKNIDALITIKYLQSFNKGSILKQHLKIYKYHLLLRKMKLKNIFNLFIEFGKNRMERNLAGCRPSLLYFDLLRLYHLNKIIQKSVDRKQ